MLEPGREDVASKLFVILCLCLFPRSKQCRSPEPSTSTAGRADDKFFCGARSCNCKVCSAPVFVQGILSGTPYYKAGVGGYHACSANFADKSGWSL